MAKKWDDGLPDTNKKWLGPIGEQIDFRPLFKILNDSGIQTKNNALYQVINQLLKNAQQNKDLTVSQFTAISVVINGFTSSVSIINELFKDATFLTATDESAGLPSSRELLPGTNVSFDDTVIHKRTVNVTGITDGGSSSGAFLTILGDIDNDEPMMMLSSSGVGSTGPQGPQGIQGPMVYLEPEVLESDSPIPGAKGDTGLTGSQGPVGPAVYLELDVLEPELPIPGLPGSKGDKGDTGSQGAVGIFLDPIDGEDGFPIPGIKGTDGLTGAQGPTGPAIFLDVDIPDAEIPIPGIRGADGAQGATGASGLMLLIDLGDVIDPEPPIPGATGATGPQGPAGSGSGSGTSFIVLDGIDGEESYIPGPPGKVVAVPPGLARQFALMGG